MGQMGLRFGCQGFSPSKRKVGAQLGAPVMVGLSVLEVIKLPKVQVCISEVAALGVLTGVGLVMHCFLFVFTCLFMCFVSV